MGSEGHQEHKTCIDRMFFWYILNITFHRCSGTEEPVGDNLEEPVHFEPVC